MEPTNSVYNFELETHDKIAGYFAKAEINYPKAARLGGLAIFLITLATKPLIALAAAVEAVVKFVINLLGSIFNANCRHHLWPSTQNFIENTFYLALTPIITPYQAFARGIACTVSPTDYKNGSLAKLRFQLKSKFFQ